MKSKHKKIIIFVLLSLITILLVGFAYIYYRHTTTVHFSINEKIITSYSITLEYEDHLKISPEKINLKATRNNKDITSLINVKEHSLTQLKTYPIDFYIKDNESAFITINVKVVDTSAPILSGEKQYTINEGDTFDESQLKLSAFDTFDKDLTHKIKCDHNIDTTKAGKQTIVYYVEDSSGNRSEHTVVVEVKEKITYTETNNTTTQIVENPNDYTVLVNKKHVLPNGYSPSDLTLIEGGQYLRFMAANSANQMLASARNEGITIYIVSSYRSQNYQTNLFNSYMKNDPYNAPYYSAPPRSSEHELGLAIDISYDSQLHNDLHTSNLGLWMNENAHKYGWILRYPYNKTDITGYYFEPWHYRYVGVDLATHLKNNNLTLEEYYNSY